MGNRVAVADNKGDSKLAAAASRVDKKADSEEAVVASRADSKVAVAAKKADSKVAVAGANPRKVPEMQPILSGTNSFLRSFFHESFLRS